MQPRSVVVIATLALPSLVAGQDLPENARSSLAAYASSKSDLDLDGATGLDVVASYVIRRLSEPRGVADLRNDVETGVLAGTGGTSLVARTAATDFLSAAFDSGAIVRKADDKAVTLSLNALPISQLMAGSLPTGCGSADQACEVGLGRWLRGLSGSLTFSASNPARPETEGTGDTTGFLIGGRKLQGVAVRYELFVRERTTATQRTKIQEAATALSKDAGNALTPEESFETRLLELLGTEWTVDTQAELMQQAARPEPQRTRAELVTALELVLQRRLEEAFASVRSKPGIEGLALRAATARTAYVTKMNEVLADKLYRKAAAVDYAFVRPTDQPMFYQAKLAVSTPVGRRPPSSPERRGLAPSASLTANAGVSWFKPEVDQSTTWKVRDTQLSMALDWSPRAWGERRPVYTAAYYFQYMHSDGVLQFNGEAVTPGGAGIPLAGAAKTVLNTKGAIHVAQVRMSLPATGGVRFPLAVSWASRNELIKGRSFWQGHVGVSYDFSAIKSLLQRRAS